jgi:hypothetical protein
MAQLVDSIAALGQPETDIPLLILALGRCQDSRACEADVSAALRKLSGLDLADGTSVKSWQEHWHRRLTHESVVLHR